MTAGTFTCALNEAADGVTLETLPLAAMDACHTNLLSMENVVVTTSPGSTGIKSPAMTWHFGRSGFGREGPEAKRSSLVVR